MSAREREGAIRLYGIGFVEAIDALIFHKPAGLKTAALNFTKDPKTGQMYMFAMVVIPPALEKEAEDFKRGLAAAGKKNVYMLGKIAEVCNRLKERILG